MAKITYDWQKEKQKYLVSPIADVGQFLVSSLSIDPKFASGGSYAKNTKGLKKEKEAMKKQQTEVVTKDLINNVESKKLQANLVQAKQDILDIVTTGITSLKSMTTNKTVDLNSHLNSIKVYYEIVKLELGEPTKIDKLQGDKENPIKTETSITYKIIEPKNKE